MNNKHICIHGHFYQPPRENPWLKEVELQESAFPFHDWNERINAECYIRNAASRILDEEGRITEITNNYSKISFNFGPTLLQWLEKKSPGTYNAILEADKKSMENFNGHGSALAQTYNHIIMPLANDRDKETQVIWGIRDFKKRFGRDPEGMWLSETAVDYKTLEYLAEHGIRFTILSPYQAKEVLRKGQKNWKDVSGANINPRKPYLCKLPSGKEIVIFFYDGPVSQAVAFENLLESGEKFAGRLMSGFKDSSENDQLVNIATDGETYGHHHRFGEMALSFALNHISSHNLAKITIYGEYLDSHPPEDEVRIIEDSSWSCIHGVERWKSDCGCNTGGNESWNQQWRKPLREAFDWARELMIPLYENEMKKFHPDPWFLRNEYIEVIFADYKNDINGFIADHTNGELTGEEKSLFLKLLEMQYHSMLMYTSCGWFFDEVTGIETMQDIAYAARAIQLAGEISGEDFESELIERLSQAKSNIPENKDAGEAYKKFTLNMKLDMPRIAAHFAVSSLFQEDPSKIDLFSYSGEIKHYEDYTAGKYKLALGNVLIRSNVTLERMNYTFTVLHLGDHHMFGGVTQMMDEENFEKMAAEIKRNFEVSNVHEILHLMDNYLGMHNYSFWHLFKDEQRKILSSVLENSKKTVQEQFSIIYNNNFHLFQAMNELNISLPKAYRISMEFYLNSKIKNILKQEKVNFKKLEEYLNTIKKFNIELEKVRIEFLATLKVDTWIEDFKKSENIEHLVNITRLIKLFRPPGLELELWNVQNEMYYLKEKIHREKCNEDPDLCEKFDALFHLLKLT